MHSENLPAALADRAKLGPPGLSDALRIWWAGVRAVTPEQLFRSEVHIESETLFVCDEAFDLRGLRRIVVVGAGKASAGMATALYKNCLHKLEHKLAVSGWINAPAGAFQPGSAGPIHLHAARPPGFNEPTEAAVAGTLEITKLVRQCDANDLCIVLISGGGSALLVAPIEGITLQDKRLVARKLAAAGANIEQLNTVRRALSRVKGGGLAAMCKARQLVSLIISDVLGDPLETIASGPTIQSSTTTPLAALNILERIDVLNDPELRNVVSVLSERSATRRGAASAMTRDLAPVSNIVLANNATAVDAAGVKAVELGYRYIMQAANKLEGDVTELARTVGHTLEQLSAEDQVDCWISGGEPTVLLPADDICGRGGRNQQLALLSLIELSKRGWPDDRAKFPLPLLFLSAGTDGEDGPTPAAGAWFDSELARRMANQRLDVTEFARRADAFTFFDQQGGLIVSDQTGTNVCDLRIAIKIKPTVKPTAGP